MKIWIILYVLLSKTICFAQDTIPTFKSGKKDKCALFNTYNVQITSYQYDCGYGKFYNGISKVHKNGKYGYINYKGKEVVPCIYDHANDLSEGLIAVSKNGKSGFIDKSGKVQIPFIYSKTSSFSEGLAAVKKNGAVGYINKEGIFVIPPKYDWLSQPFSEGFAVVEKNEKFGYIDRNGNQITEVKYFLAEDFKNGIAKVSYYGVEIAGDYCGFPLISGYINTKGKEFIPAIYDQVTLWEKEKMITVSKDGNIGAYDFNGKLIIPLKYSRIGRVDKETGYIRVEKNTELGYFDGYVTRNGEEKISCKYKLESGFEDGFLYGKRYTTEEERKEFSKIKTTYSYHRSGVLDSLNNIIIPFEYEGVAQFKNGFFRVKDYTNNGMRIVAYFNKVGEKIIPFKYAYGSSFSEDGYALVKNAFDSEYYFIDTNDNMVSTPTGYDEIDAVITENLVAVQKNGKWGFINAKSIVMIPLQFDSAERFYNQMSRVSLHNKYGYINTKGKIIIPIIYDKAPYYFTSKIEELELNDKKYYFDIEGNEIIDKETIIIGINQPIKQ